MKKIFIIFMGLFLSASLLQAQTDTMYVMKAGVVINKQSIKLADVDSIIFYKPTVATNSYSIVTALIPAGTFTMGSPENEIDRNTNETQFTVTLSAFRMCKYEITNTQYATFLNAKGIGSDGKYVAGVYPTEPLIINSTSRNTLTFTNNKWVPVNGYENHPVMNVTWYGATEFATYVGGTLPTEAQWEYACRAGTNTPFNTGNCLTNEQANYDWSRSYNTCINTVTTYPVITQTVGTCPANAWGLHDMHGNLNEWCNDWYGEYPTIDQTNPTGPTSGFYRVIRGGSWKSGASGCRSALRTWMNPNLQGAYPVVGFRVVFVP